MPISLGDAVMVFRGDTENLDAAFAGVPPKAEKSFGEAAKFNAAFNEELDATGENVKFAGERILSLTDSFRTLSIQGPERLKAKLDESRNAFATLQAAGVTAKGTILQATIKVTEREIAYRTALGESTAQLTQELTALQAQYAKLSSPVQAIGQNFTFTGKAASTAGALAEEAGAAMEDAGRRGSEAFHETRGSIDLLSHEMGVTLPRELKGFLAGLGPIQGLLSSAFSVFAVTALIGVIVDATKKTTEWVAATFIFTEAQKNLNAVLLESNKAIISYEDQIKELIRQEELLGKTAAQQSTIKVRFAVEDEGKVSEKIRDVSNEIYGLRNGLVTVPQAIDVVNAKLRELHKDASEEDLKKILLPSNAEREAVVGALSGVHDQLLAQQKAFHVKTQTAENEEGLALTQIQNSFDQARVNAHQAINSARIDAEHEHARIILGLTQASYSDQLKEQASFEEKKFQAEIATQRSLLEILQRDPEKNVNDIVTANAKIEELQKEHQAKLLADTATFIEKRRAILEEARRPETSPLLLSLSLPDPEKLIGSFIDPITQRYHAGMELIQSDTTVAFARLFQAFRDLGIQGSLVFDSLGNIVSPLEQAQHAYENLKISGVATYADLLKGQIALVEAEIQHKEELGQSTVEEEKSLSRLEDQWARLTGQVRNNSRQIDLWNRQAKRDFDNVGAAFQHLRDRGKQALDAVSDSLEKAIASAILGQQSFAAALAQAVAKTLAAWAAEDAIHALRAVALGFYNLAIHDYSGAADAFKSAALYGAVAAGEGVAAAALGQVGQNKDQGGQAAPGNLPPTPATSANPNPPTPPSIVHLATGGLVQQRTLAVIGDSIAASGNASEAIIPLNDRRATGPIADAIAGELVQRLRPDIAQPNPPDPYAALRDIIGGVVIHQHFKGNLISHQKLMREQTRLVNKGRAVLKATVAGRITRTG